MYHKAIIKSIVAICATDDEIETIQNCLTELYEMKSSYNARCVRKAIRHFEKQLQKKVN